MPKNSIVTKFCHLTLCDPVIPSLELGTGKTAGWLVGWLVGGKSCLSRVCLSAQRRRGASRAINRFERRRHESSRAP